MDIQQFFAETVRLDASDLHLVAGFPPILRLSGELKPMTGVSIIPAAEMEAMIFPILNSEQKDLLITNREIDFSLTAANNRFRANVYYQKGAFAAAFRLVPAKIKSISALGLPGICQQLTNLRQGLVLVTGPTGHGKSTTLASMIQTINTTQARHIVTIEDPIEFIYPPGLAIVSQREMHADTHSWNVALRSVLREDPDVVLVGEMRDFETIQAAITVAETGHLVFGTLHTNSAAQSVDRIVDVFPENQQGQVRLQLSFVLEAIVSQRLLPAVGGGRVVIGEVMTASAAVRTTIREGKTHMLDNIIQTSGELGMNSMEAALAQAVKEGKISVETATAFSTKPEELARLLKYA